MLIVWEAIVFAAKIPEFLLPSPSRVLIFTYENASLMFNHALYTIFITVLGFVLTILLGFALSIAIVWSATFEDTVYPIIVMTQVIPKVAIAPLLVIYLGFADYPKIVIAFILSFFPLVINMTLGLKAVEPELVELLQAFKSSKWQVFAKARIPNSIPYIIEGLKIAMTLAIIGAVVGEFVSGNKGLGYLILVAGGQSQTVMTYSSLLVLVVIGVVLFEAIAVMGRFIAPWWARSASAQ